MFKLAMVMAAAVLTNLSTAHGESKACVWALLSEVEATAWSPTEFIELQTQFPKYFANHDAQYVTSAYIHLKKMEFIGGTICQDSDPRLFADFASYGVCREENGIGHCAMEPMPAISEKDPCQL